MKAIIICARRQSILQKAVIRTLFVRKSIKMGLYVNTFMVATARRVDAPRSIANAIKQEFLVQKNASVYNARTCTGRLCRVMQIL
mmetsp:Transcript_38847/g.99713  ORF Transcript_38847/g.99713 Transcript_38847/m.99713 type:complete len:85 (-) Transcript_38847:234-488(-)